MAQKVAQKYENNPFYITYNGLMLLFKNAQSVAIYATILAGIGVIMSAVNSAVDMATSYRNESAPTEMGQLSMNGIDIPILLGFIGVAVLVTVIFMLVFLFLYGILEYTAAELAKGKKVTLEQAIVGVWRGFLGYTWVYVLVFGKLFLWTLLFIIPGIIMSVRYMLAGTTYFAENKRGNDAIKRSSALTKGAWFTTFAGFGLWNFITFNLITPLVNPSAATILYRQLKDATDSGIQKPTPHWLSWVTLLVPLAFVVLVFILVTFFILASWAVNL
jgi:hypothetical protein